MTHAVAFAIDFAFHVNVFVGVLLLLQRVADLTIPEIPELYRKVAAMLVIGMVVGLVPLVG